MSNRKTRSELLRRYGHHCHWCAKPMNLRVYKPGEMAPDDAATIDHLKPRSKGGSNKLWNLRLAHRRCNMERGNKLMIDCWQEVSPLSPLGGM